MKLRDIYNCTVCSVILILLSPSSHSQETDTVQVRLSCRGDTFQYLIEGIRNLGEKESIIVLEPKNRRLALIVGSFQWLGTDQLEIGINEYFYEEADHEPRSQRARVSIDRTTLDFKAGYRDALGIFYEAEGKCVVINPQI